VLTGVLVGNLEEASAQQQLDTALPNYRSSIEKLQCAAGQTWRPTDLRCSGPDPSMAPRAATNQELVNSPTQYLADLHNNIQLLPNDRLMLVGARWTAVYDSQEPVPTAKLPDLTTGKRTENVIEVSFTLGKTRYMASAIRLQQVSINHDPLKAQWVVLARSRDAVAAQATGAVLPKLLLAGGISLLFAMGVTLLLGQAIVRPLRELARAAEELAAGNYSRRVKGGGGDEIGVLGAAFNRMAEAVEKARGMQRDFLANVSHELKTPLTSLIGFSQALVDGSLQTEAERHRAATILHEEAVRVLRMSQELLDLARVEGGHLSLRLQAVDLADMLRQETEFVRSRAVARSVSLTFELHPNLLPVAADPERLHQILENLLDNAVKYAPSGSQILIRTRFAPPGVETVISNPVGTHRPDPERMFERFYRADPSRSSGAGGVGLGLAISRQLASAQAGRLWADFDDEGRLCMHLLLYAADPLPDPETGRFNVEPRTLPPPEPATTRLAPPY
jgi:signal transduction histidine kinase